MPIRAVENLAPSRSNVRVVEDLAPRKVSQAEDVLLSGLTGGAQGIFGLVGSAGDLVALGKNLPQKAADFLENRGWAPKGTSQNMATAIRLMDRGGVPSKVMGVGREALAETLRSRGAPKTAEVVSKGRLPTTRDLEDFADARRSYHTPQTVAGEYARTIAQTAPAALLPGTATQRIVNVLAPAVTSETAGQVARNVAPESEPYARVAGALIGGLGAGLATRPSPTTRMLAEGSRGATDQQILAAQALREDAARRGVTLTQAEALQQVTDNGTGLGRMQRILEGTPAGSERIAPVMAQRPGQVRQAVNQFADTVAPAAPDPYVFGQQAQGAAGETLNGVRQQINANARPFYEALATERMPVAAPQYQELVQNPAYQEALGHVRNNPILNREIAALPDDSLAVVNEVVKHLDTLAENARPNPAASTGNAQLAAAYEAAGRNADELASAVSEPWRLSRQMVASQHEQFLDPLKAGPMGAISQTPQVGAQTRALFPASPAEGAAASTGRTMEMLPPETSQGLFRQHLMNSFNEAGQNLQGGQNQWGGAKWAATVAGNPEQQAVLNAGAQGAGANTDDMNRLIDALSATGKRQAPGSQTSYNMEAMRRLGDAGTVGEGIKAVASGPATFRRIGEALQDWQTQRNAAQLADALLAEPARATEILMQARRALPPGAALDYIERLAITVNQNAPRDRQLSAP